MHTYAIRRGRRPAHGTRWGAGCRTAVLAAVAGGACAAGGSAGDGGGGSEEHGVASYYSDALAGETTASGEPYDPRAETCAHLTHPFGTRLEVTRRDTGARVECRVNDRGPYVEGRVVDLSRRLAERLDMIDEGIVEVRLRVVPSR